MELSLFLAKVMGICFSIFGLTLLINRSTCQALLADFLSHPALILFGGAINLIIGSLIVVSHPVWEFGWPLLITLIGWLLLIRGTVWLAFPRKMSGMVAKYAASNTPFCVGGSIALVLGVLLLFFGFC